MEPLVAIVGLLLGAPEVLWTADSGVPREAHGAALLPDGKVMVQGSTRDSQLYDPAANAWLDGGRAVELTRSTRSVASATGP